MSGDELQQILGAIYETGHEFAVYGLQIIKVAGDREKTVEEKRKLDMFNRSLFNLTFLTYLLKYGSSGTALTQSTFPPKYLD